MTANLVRNVYAERHELQADMRNARVAGDTLSGNHRALDVERRSVDERLRQAEMQVVLGAEGATEARDEALARLKAIDEEQQATQRGLDAARELIQIRQAQLVALHDDQEGFPQLCREAESATAGAMRDLQDARRALGRATQSWAKATSLWAPLRAGLRRRLQELDEQEGRYYDVDAQATAPPFPISLPSNIETLTPAPAGYHRLESAGESIDSA
jgi:chromosome segregation ATPase